MTPANHSIGAIVLCGGKSRRMGSSKYLLPFGGETMLERVVRIVQQVTSAVVVVAAAGQELPALSKDVQIGRDDVPDKGPLAGISVGLSLLKSHVEAAFVTTCDAPLLSPAFVARIIQEFDAQQTDILILSDSERQYPLTAVYRSSLDEKAKALLTEDRLRPVFLQEQARVREISTEVLQEVDVELLSLRNANRPEEYEELLKIGQQRNFSLDEKSETVSNSSEKRYSSRNATAKHDVRMKGFRERNSVQQALSWLDGISISTASETVSLESSAGRVITQDVISLMNVPPFDRSAMDGYALRGHETEGAGDYNPLSLQIVGESLPGCPFPAAVQQGEAVRIMTGAPIPTGADAVLPVEYTREESGELIVTSTVPPLKHIGRTGEDIEEGTTILSTGRTLRPQDIGVLASVGIAEVNVRAKPCVRILVTGNELAKAGERLKPFQIYDSNSPMLRGLIQRDGGIIESVQHLNDDPVSIQQALSSPGADVILVSGGSSVGAEDHAPRLVSELGELAIHGVAMRPSSPAGMGMIDRTLVFLLPGNPVSCLCAYDFFAGRAIRKLGGLSTEWPYGTCEAHVSRKIVSAIGRTDYCRVMVKEDQLEPLALSGASILSSTTRANGFVIVPESLEGYGPGSKVQVYLYD